MVFNSPLTLVARNSSITNTNFIIIITVFRRIDILLIKLIWNTFAIRLEILPVIIYITFPIFFCTFTILNKILDYLILFVYAFCLSLPSNIIDLSSHQTIRIDLSIRIPILIVAEFCSWLICTNTLPTM